MANFATCSPTSPLARRIHGGNNWLVDDIHNFVIHNNNCQKRSDIEEDFSTGEEEEEEAAEEEVSEAEEGKEGYNDNEKVDDDTLHEAMLMTTTEIMATAISVVAELMESEGWLSHATAYADEMFHFDEDTDDKGDDDDAGDDDDENADDFSHPLSGSLKNAKPPLSYQRVTLSPHLAPTFSVYLRIPPPFGCPFNMMVNTHHVRVQQFFDQLGLEKVFHEIDKTHQFLLSKKKTVVGSGNGPCVSGRFAVGRRNVVTDSVASLPILPPPLILPGESPAWRADDECSQRYWNTLQCLVKTWILLHVLNVPLNYIQILRQRLGRPCPPYIRLCWPLYHHHHHLPSSTRTILPKGPPHILDIGCGVGKDVLNYTAIQPASVTFVDISPENLAETERRWRRHGFNNYPAAFMPADASFHLPLPSQLSYHMVSEYATHESLLLEREAQQRNDTHFRRGGSLQQLPGLNGFSYDLIICHYMMQHCHDQDHLTRTIFNMKSVLAEQGKMVCIIPNAPMIRFLLSHPDVAYSLGCRLWQSNDDNNTNPKTNKTSSSLVVGEEYNFQGKKDGTVYREYLIEHVMLENVARQVGLIPMYCQPLSSHTASACMTQDAYWQAILACESRPEMLVHLTEKDTPPPLRLANDDKDVASAIVAPTSLFDIFDLWIFHSV